MLKTAPGAQSDIIRLMLWVEVARWNFTSIWSISQRSASLWVTASIDDRFAAVPADAENGTASTATMPPTSSIRPRISVRILIAPAPFSPASIRDDRDRRAVRRLGGQHPISGEVSTPAVPANLVRKPLHVDRLLEVAGEAGAR